MRLTLPIRLRRALIDHPVWSVLGAIVVLLGAVGGPQFIVGVTGLVGGLLLALLLIVVYLALLSVAYSNELDAVKSEASGSTGAADTTVASYRRALNDMVERHSGAYTEDIHFTYHIGKDAGGDTERRDCQTSASLGQTLMWRYFEGSSSEGAGADYQARTPRHSPELTVLYLKIEDAYMKYLVLFPKLVTDSTPVSWWVHCPWPGTFSDFRADGRTSIEYNAKLGSRLTQFTVIFDDPAARGTPGESLSRGRMEPIEIGGSYALQWNAPPEEDRAAKKYIFSVGAKEGI